jgi:hypothetical protein
MLLTAQEVEKQTYTVGSHPREDSAASTTNCESSLKPHLKQKQAHLLLGDGLTLPARHASHVM